MSKQTPNNENALNGTIETIEDNMNSPHPKVGKLVDGFARRGFGAALLLPSLLVSLPTGAIPGVPFVSGLIVILMSVQILLGKKSPWIPKRIRNIEFKQHDISKYVDMVKPYVKKIDQYIYPRWGFLFTPITFRVLSLLTLVLGAAILVFGFIPFAVFVPGIALTVVALGMMVKDGFLVICGALISLGCLYLIPMVLDKI